MSYARVLRAPGAARLATAAVVGRLPGGMATLSIILLVQDTTGSFGAAGAVAGAHGVASALGQPLQGRLIDRYGQPRVLLPAAAVFAASYSALAAVSPVAVLLGLGVVSGLAFPALAAGLRALWPRLVAAGERQAAYALDAAVQEVVLLGGPLLVAALIAVGSPTTLVLVTAGLSLAGTIAFATAPAARASSGTAASGAATFAGPLRAAGIRALVAVTFLGSSLFGWLQVTVSAFAEERGEPAAAGVLFALWSAGGLLAGLVYGSRRWRGSPLDRYAILTAVLVGAAAVPAFAGSLAGIAAAITVTGCVFAPWLATSSVLVDAVSPTGAVTEAFAWLVTASNAGAATGAAIAGPVIEANGTDTALALAPSCAVLALAALLLTRRTVRP